MIPSARPTVSPVEITIITEICFVRWDFENWGRTDGPSDTTCDNMTVWLWVGFMDQNIAIGSSKKGQVSFLKLLKKHKSMRLKNMHACD